MTTLTSKFGSIEFGEGSPTLLINDQLRIMDQASEILEELQAGNLESIVNLARHGKNIGLEVVDILISHPDVDEINLLPKIARAVMDEVGCYISLDTRNPAALEAALEEMRPYKVIINSVTAEKSLMDIMLPMAAYYQAALIVMPMGLGTGVPHTVQERVGAAKALLKRAEGFGIPREDLVVDGIVLASSVERNSMSITLRTLQALVKELGMTKILGIGNAGHGMPTPTWIDLAYFISAIPWGMHAALVNPDTPGLMETVLAADFLNDRDAYGKRYIAHYRSAKKKVKGV